MPRHRTKLIAGTFLLGVAACEGQQASRASQGARPSDTTAAPSVVAPSGATPAASATAPGVRLSVARSPEHDAFLTDASGRALYMLEEDAAGASSCYEMCAAIWPPLMAGQGTPFAGDSAVRRALIGTAQRRGGGAQVTYNGQPLYYYMGDARPGETRGQHVEDSWGEWYLMSPSGRHVEDREDDGRRGSRRGQDRGDGNR